MGRVARDHRRAGSEQVIGTIWRGCGRLASRSSRTARSDWSTSTASLTDASEAARRRRPNWHSWAAWAWPTSGPAMRRTAKHWRDSDFQAEGAGGGATRRPRSWTNVRDPGRGAGQSALFPDLDLVGNDLAQVFGSSPVGGNGKLRLMFLLAIASAARRIQIGNSDLCPRPDHGRDAGGGPAARVDVEILVPGPFLDAQIVRRASRAMWGPLLEAGVRIYEYQPTMYHTKDDDGRRRAGCPSALRTSMTARSG